MYGSPGHETAGPPRSGGAGRELVSQQVGRPPGGLLAKASRPVSRGGAPISQWYVLLEGDRIIAGAGVIEHDFHLRKDLSPNVCALYVEEPWRNRGLAGRLLNLICEDVAALGVETLYLVTEHTAFYERYGWEFFCLAQEENSPSWLRLYRRTTASPLQ